MISVSLITATYADCGPVPNGQVSGFCRFPETTGLSLTPARARSATYPVSGNHRKPGNRLAADPPPANISWAAFSTARCGEFANPCNELRRCLKWFFSLNHRTKLGITAAALHAGVQRRYKNVADVTRLVQLLQHIDLASLSSL